MRSFKCIKFANIFRNVQKFANIFGNAPKFADSIQIIRNQAFPFFCIIIINSANFMHFTFKIMYCSIKNHLEGAGYDHPI